LSDCSCSRHRGFRGKQVLINLVVNSMEIVEKIKTRKYQIAINVLVKIKHGDI
jgi:C4-dicarboxylate-specific signal transduction histidine kinase